MLGPKTKSMKVRRVNQFV